MEFYAGFLFNTDQNRPEITVVYQQSFVETVDKRPNSQF